MRLSTTRANKILKAVCALLFWVGVWFLAALYVGQELILPAPASVIKTFVRLCGTGDFWLAAASSLLRIFGGLLGGIALGTLLAALTSWSRIADTLLSPAIRVVRATPVASFIILALLWIGKAGTPGFISMLMVVPVVWGGVSAAVGETDKRLLEMARAYKLGWLGTLRYVYIPSAAPAWNAACVTGVGLAWKSGIAAEVLCLPKLAIGTNVYYSKIYLETPSLFAWTALVVILSLVVEKGFVSLVKRIRPASAHPRGARRTCTDKTEYGSCEPALENVCFSYGGKRVLSGLSARLGPGVTCVTGPSGSGKTTLLRILAGLERPESGRVSGLPDKTAYMFQEDRLLPWLTAEENVAVVLPRERRGEAVCRLRDVELENEADNLPGELSGGQARRVALARALAFGGRLLLLDEPFKGLDAELTERMIPLVTGTGATVVAATHSPREIELLNAERLAIDTNSSPC